MKRMAKLLFEASRGACGTVSLFGTTNETPADRPKNPSPSIFDLRTGALDQGPVDPVSHGLPQRLHPLSIEMLEIARAMDQGAGAGGPDGRPQIEEPGTMADRRGPDQLAYRVAVFEDARPRIMRGGISHILLARNLRSQQPVT